MAELQASEAIGQPKVMAIDSQVQIAKATKLYKSGNVAAAVRQLHVVLRHNPRSGPALHLMGVMALGQGELEVAADYLSRAVKCEPNNGKYMATLGDALNQSKRLDVALECYRKAVALGEDGAGMRVTLASLLQNIGRSDEAFEHYHAALDFESDSVTVLSHYADLLEKVHRLDESRAIAERGLKLDPTDPSLHLICARIERRQSQAEAATERLGQLLTFDHIEPHAPVIHAELGELLDYRREFDEAFKHFEESNRLAALQLEDDSRGVDKNNFRQRVEQLRDCCGPGWAESTTQSPPAQEDEVPAFLIGFPRSGTTLLDQILDSHPAVQTLEERLVVHMLRRKVQSMAGGYPVALAGLSHDVIHSLRDVYARVAAFHVERQPGTLFIDKFPLNIIDVPLIWRVYPSAKFIVMLRHPCDVCLSCFMNHFHLNDAMANFLTLEDTATSYASVMSLWQQYKRVLPIRYQEVRYEDLVNDMPTEAKRLLEFLGLGWNDAVLRFNDHARQRTKINTPSYSQVTQPLYRRAIARWQSYASQMAPVMDHLLPFITAFGYGTEVQS